MAWQVVAAGNMGSRVLYHRLGCNRFTAVDNRSVSGDILEVDAVLYQHMGCSRSTAGDNRSVSGEVLEVGAVISSRHNFCHPYPGVHT